MLKKTFYHNKLSGEYMCAQEDEGGGSWDAIEQEGDWGEQSYFYEEQGGEEEIPLIANY